MAREKMKTNFGGFLCLGICATHLSSCDACVPLQDGKMSPTRADRTRHPARRGSFRSIFTPQTSMPGCLVQPHWPISHRSRSWLSLKRRAKRSTTAFPLSIALGKVGVGVTGLFTTSVCQCSQSMELLQRNHRSRDRLGEDTSAGHGR